MIYKRWGKVAYTNVANEEPPTMQSPLQGARIIALDSLLASITQLTTHSAVCGGKCTVTGETCCGLATILYVICNECGMHFTLESSTRVNSDYMGNRWTVNVGALWGQMAAGGGSARLNESLAIDEVPGISKSVMSTVQDTVSWGPYMTKIGCAIYAVKSYHTRLEENHRGLPLYKRKLTDIIRS